MRWTVGLSRLRDTVFICEDGVRRYFIRTPGARYTSEEEIEPRLDAAQEVAAMLNCGDRPGWWRNISLHWGPTVRATPKKGYRYEIRPTLPAPVGMAPVDHEARYDLRVGMRRALLSAAGLSPAEISALESASHADGREEDGWAAKELS